MKSVNKVTLIGAVGKDPEIRFTAQGLCVASFSLATSQKQKDKDEVTQWHDCVAFGKLAEIVEKYVFKGSKLYLEGTIQYQKVDKDSVVTKYTKIIVNDVSMLSSNDNSNQSSSQGKQKVRDSGTSSAADLMSTVDDEIPF